MEVGEVREGSGRGEGSGIGVEGMIEVRVNRDG